VAAIRRRCRAGVRIARKLLKTNKTLMKSITALLSASKAENVVGTAVISRPRKRRIEPADKLPRSEQEFAAKYKTKLSLDEVGDPIIPGTNGHLYFDDGRLCWMKLGEVEHLVKARNLLADCTEFWFGDGEDLEVRGIPPELWEKTMDLAGVKFRRTRKRKGKK